jgi:general secretion pathway protein G
MIGFRRRAQRGVTLVELVCVSAILVILAGVAIPVAHTMVKRQKELELRQALRKIRVALDEFQFDPQRYPGIRAKYLNATNEEGYPEELKWLVEGVEIGDAAGTRVKYLRRLPVDPITGEREWGTRSSRDRPDALFSDGLNIFDVYSLSDKKALDDTYYREW